ncbi:MAG: UDP-N-acetylmuramoyl-L-alanyl-D-glutamate--2,6-diaminopimelate ligase [Planctomycetaceae bacterium]|nr:UDP-N-acetylmuramoyl-L-alanyl-D-glutamate--2,6-diaminopimelate ligase [Planctomycetaceae bacterium]
MFCSTEEEIWINSCTCDIRTLRAGDLFVAIDNDQSNGHDHIDEAQRRGCKAIIAERLIPDIRVPFFVVQNTKDAYGILCHKLYGNPGDRLKIVAVTGTLGKTCTSFLMAGVLAEANYPVGVISSVGIFDGERMYPTVTSTPPANELAYWLSRMVLNGCVYLVVEASSYAIDQHYFSGIFFDVVCLTNIRSDHLDYHQTVEHYRRTKLNIFRHAKKDAIVICNADDCVIHAMIPLIDHPLLTVGMHHESEISGMLIERTNADQTFYVSAGSETVPICTRIIGDSHLYNTILAVAFGISQNIELKQVIRGIERVDSVPGRMERIECGQPFGVFLDSAQNPEALAANLSTLREVTSGEIYCLFGSTGDGATPEKREELGKVLHCHADHVILTAESLTTERPDQSIREMLRGVSGMHKVQIIRDRADAISSTLAKMLPGDCVLIVGNGQEAMPASSEDSLRIDERTYVREWLYENQPHSLPTSH